MKRYSHFRYRGSGKPNQQSKATPTLERERFALTSCWFRYFPDFYNKIFKAKRKNILKQMYKVVITLSNKSWKSSLT